MGAGQGRLGEGLVNEGDTTGRTAEPSPWSGAMVAPPFVSPDILEKADLPKTRKKLSAIVHTEILPRLLAKHVGGAGVKGPAWSGPTQHEIARLAALVLDPDLQLSTDFVAVLRNRGLSAEDLFVNLLEPAARCLGTMWDNDECSFFDVIVGVGRLQQLLSLFSRSFAVPAFSEKRRVCIVSIADERHSFGVEMVETFLRAGGWDVRSERGTTLQQIAPLMRSEWFSVVGLTASSDGQLDSLAATIHQIRSHSRNPAVGVMVGGAPFTARPELAAKVGADATAVNAPAAVVLAQRLFDIGAETDWHDSFGPR